MIDRRSRTPPVLPTALLALGIAAAACSSKSTPLSAAATTSGTTEDAEGTVDVAGDGIGGGTEEAGEAIAGTVVHGAEGSDALGPVDVGAGGVRESVPASAEKGPVDAGSGTGGEGDAGMSGELSPLDRIVLFDGTNLDEWRTRAGSQRAGWELPGDGTMVVVPGSGNISTLRTFEDLFVHVEYRTPALPANVTGQDRGNSGVYLNSRYEIQILDSFGQPPTDDGCGAIYQLRAPSSTACYGQEVWNTYDIEFRAARWDAQGNKQADARVLSAYLNGVLVQRDVDIPNSTGLGEPEVPGPRPLVLQDHGNRVAFRNVWISAR
jgi:hypothetical protein